MDRSGPGLSPSSLLLVARVDAQSSQALSYDQREQGFISKGRQMFSLLVLWCCRRQVALHTYLFGLALLPGLVPWEGLSRAGGSGEVPGACTVVRGLGEPED